MNQEIQYIGETLWPGFVGHIFILISFVSILFSIYSYRKSVKTNLDSWIVMGRSGFIIHSVTTLALIALIFYMMINKLYEYSYVQQHVSDDLPLRYILSAFWEGQEGSFLLWMFWHIILGLVLISRRDEWEGPVLLFLGLIQAFMASMLLGIHIEIGDFVYKLGSNPTVLLRDVIAAPIFEKADYLSSIKGSGLNPLLQNYWNTIHPPTTFLGFASTTIPFAFAAGGFYSGKYKAWTSPALKWSLFSAGMLGVGILMGSAWAYEALSFGGYWAWDPVENMSFVPWLILVAGVHTNLIAKNTGRAIKSTFLYYCLTLVLILYSTYLTRSGILGDTSAHAFTEMGLEPQLISMVGTAFLVSLILFLANRKLVPTFEKEESIYSREFWMSIGSLVLLFSGIIITSSTSLPVFNAIMTIFDPSFIGTVIEDPIPHYNKFQVWTSLLVMMLAGSTIFLRYRTQKWSKTQLASFAKSQALHFVVAAILCGVLSFWIDLYHWKYVALACVAFYTMSSNATFIFKVAKNNLRVAAAAISHVGFGIMIIGILASGLNEKPLTTNPFVMKGLIKDQDLATSVKLIQNEPFFVNNYWLTYESDTIVGNTRTFKIKFQELDSTSGKGNSFYVQPNVMYTNDFTKIAATNPDAKHYLDRDIFTTVVSLPKAQQDVKFAKEEEDSLQYLSYTLSPGDTLFTQKHYGLIKEVSLEPKNEEYLQHKNDVGISVKIEFKSLVGDSSYLAEPTIGVRENLLYQYPSKVDPFGVKVRLAEATFDNFYTTEEKLNYESFELKQGQDFQYNGTLYQLAGFERTVSNPNYIPEDNDVKIQAIITSQNDKLTVKPIYVIRNGSPFNIKDYDPNKGIHARIVHINPVDETFTIMMATDDRLDKEVILEIAENVPRSDVIILEALIFPGINLFWSGSCIMLFGFFLALYGRNKRRENA